MRGLEDADSGDADFGATERLPSNDRLGQYDQTKVMGRLTMRQNLPPLNWLRTFEASARHLSFTHAAAELNLTQAAVSKQIKLLEQYLGEMLFQRNARSLSLTRMGSAYLPRVREAIELLADGTAEVFGYRRSTVLSVRVTVGFSTSWLAPRLVGFLRRYPERPVRILSSVWNDDLNRDGFDLDIRYGSGAWPGFRVDRLTWEELTPVCSPALLSGVPPLRCPADLQHHPLLHVLGYEEGWAAWLRAAGLENMPVRQGYQFDTTLVAQAVAASGIGVALGRLSVIGRDLEAGRLVAPFDLTTAVDEAFYLIAPPDGTLHPDASVFRDWLLEEARADRDAVRLPTGMSCRNESSPVERDRAADNV